MSEEVQPIMADEAAAEETQSYDANFWGVKEEEAAESAATEAEETETETEAAKPADEAALPAEQLPEKFRGKSAAEIASMYQHLERFLGLPAAERQSAMQQVGIIAPADAAPGVGSEAAAIDDSTLTRQQPIAKQRFSEMVQQEKVRLEALGYAADKVTAELESKREQLSASAWSYAEQQDSYLQSAIQQGIQSVLGDLLPMITPAIGDKLYSADVASYFQSVPVHGVTADEVTAEISRAGINPLEWRKADAGVKAAFIDRATKEVFYAKSLRRQAAMAAQAVKAPAQAAPATVKGGISSMVNPGSSKIAQAFAGYLDPADLKDI